MPIFDNELLGNVSDRTITPDRPMLSSPDIKEVNVSLNPVSAPVDAQSNNIERKGSSIDEISNLAGAPSKTPTFGSPTEMVKSSELLDNKRYPVFQRGVDLENVYGLHQSGWSQLGNGIVKMAATGLGTFAQSFATIPNTVNAIKDGKFSDLAGNPDGYEGSIDNWLKNIEDKFPNYYTRVEQQHPFRAAIPFTTGSANFWGDKVIKNLGFTIGAIGGAVVQDLAIGALTSGVGEIPGITAQVGKAALWLNKIFTGTKDVSIALEEAKAAGVGAEGLLNMAHLTQVAAATKVSSGLRYGLNIYGSARTEAGVEARDGYRQVKEDLVKQYKFEHVNAEPTAEDMTQINEYATDAMNTRFGINMVLLSVSNAIQFDNLFRTFGKATEKGVSSSISKEIGEAGKIGLIEGSLDTFEKKVGGIVGKTWDAIKPKLPMVLSEGVYEEGGQYAAERGTLDYYTRKYRKKDNLGTWNDLNETLSATTKGLQDQFGTSDGLQNMFLGALSALITSGAMGKIDNIRGKGTDAQLQRTLQSLNQYGLTGNFANKYADTLNTAVIAKEMKDAITKKDIFTYKNLKNDMFFNFVTSRLPSGMHDVTIEQLNMLKDLKEKDFEETFGMSFDESNKKTVSGYVDGLVEKANRIKNTTDSLDKMFINPFKHSVNPETVEDAEQTRNHNIFNQWKVDLTRYATITPEVNERINAINQKVMAIHPLLNTEILSKLTSKEGLSTLSKTYEQRAIELDSLLAITTDIKTKSDTKAQIKALRTMSERIQLGLSKRFTTGVFNNLLNFELNNQDATKEDIIPVEKTAELYKYGQDIVELQKSKQIAKNAYETLSEEDGFNKYFKEAEELVTQKVPVTVTPGTTPTVTHTFTNKVGASEDIEINKFYELPSAKVAKSVKMAEDRFKVTSPDKTVTFYSTAEDAQIAVDDINKDIAALAKVKVIALNSDGTIKVEDLAGNIQNIDPTNLAGYSRIQTPEERLGKDKDQLDSEQDLIDITSGGIFTGNPLLENEVPEQSLKDVSIFFASSITESEGYNNPLQSAPHITRSREFLNNAKSFKNRGKLDAILVTLNNEKALGLEGLTQLSYGTNSMADATNVDTGFVAQVFVVQDKGKTYFVDKNGKKLTEVGKQLDLNHVIFQTMPTTATLDSRGNPRYRKDQKDEFIALSKAWAVMRKDIFSDTIGQYKIKKFTISRGIPIENTVNGLREQNHVGATLISKDEKQADKIIATQEGLIQISIDGKISHQNQNLTFSKGRPLLQFDDTLVFLANTKFTSEKAKSIFEVIKAFVEDIQKQSEAGQKIKLNPNYSNFLKNVLYYGKNGGKSENKFKINTDTMTVTLGNKSYNISEIAARESEIIDQLENTYHNVNKDTLGKGNFNQKFIEYVYIKDALQEVEWRNYQVYLLSSKNADGSPRNVKSTPLLTSVAQATESHPYSFKAKYSTLSDFELPIQQVPPAPIIPGVPTIGEFKMDGVTQHTFKGFASGPVNFTGTVDDTGGIEVTVLPNKTIETASANAAFVANTVVPTLIAINKLDPTATTEDMVKMFIAYKLIDELNKLKTPVAPTVVAPVVVTPPVVVAPIVPFNPNVASPPSDNYRRVENSEQGEDRITTEEIQLFREYVKENIPNMPIEVLEQLIDTFDNEKAWGVFENGVAKFYKGAIRGTEYHELFEGIWKSFISPEEQQSLLDEFKAKKGTFLDRQSGKQVIYADATNSQAKERIADDFADYRLGKLPARSLGERILNFFKNIIEFVKQFVNKPSQKTELFRSIDTGRFKENIIPERVKTESPEYSRIPGVTETQAFQFVGDMAIRSAQFIFGDDKKTIYDVQQITGKAIYDRIKADYTRENKIQQFGEKSFDLLFKRTRTFLRTLGVNFTEEDKIDTNDSETNNKAYAPEPFTTDWKKTSPFAIKFTAALLPMVEAMNQQESTSLQLPKRSISTQALGYVLNNFSRVFATLMDKISNTSSIEKVREKLLDLAKYDANYVRFFQRVGGDLSTGTIPFSNFKHEDWRLFIDFFQTFTKQRPDALIQYTTTENDVYTAPAEIYGISRELQREWFKNMRVASKDPHSIIFWNSSVKAYQVKNLRTTITKVEKGWQVTDYNKDVTVYDTELKAKNAAVRLSFPVKTTQDMIKFLSNLGITATMENYLSMNTYQRADFNKAVSFIRTYIQDSPDIGTLNGRTLGIKEPMATLANLIVKVTNPNQENTHTNVDGTKSQSYENNNVPSIFENEFNESTTRDELLNKRKELNDVFSKNSIVLKEGGLFINEDGDRIKDMKVSHIEGILDIDRDKGISTSKLSKGDRFTQEINQNLNGNYYILIPADSSREWMLNMGNYISFEDVQGGRIWNKVNKVFRGYLTDDIALALDADNRKTLKNIGSKATELRFFKDILSTVDKDGNLVSTKVLDGINSLIAKDASQKTIEKYVDKNIDAINEAVKKFITEKVTTTKSILTETNQIIVNVDDTYMYKGIDNRFINEKRTNTLNKFELSEEDVNDILTFTNVNYILNNIEFHKILFGDPYQFAIKNGKLDETKRLKSFISPRKTMFDHPEYNSFLNREFNNAGDIELEDTDIGYHTFGSFAQTVTLDDIVLQTTLFPNPFEETDAFSTIIDTSYREVKLKNNQWSNTAERWHQWQMAYTRQNIPGYTYTNDLLKEQDVALMKTPEPIFKTEVLKPIVSGSKHGIEHIDIDIDKMSQMPLYFKAVQGTNLEKLYTKMWTEEIDYVVFASGRKAGVESVHKLYNKGIFNNEPFAKNTIVDIPWSIYGIQVETSHENETEQTRGSQITKMSSMDMFDNGIPVSPEAQQHYARNTEMLNKIHEHAYNTLLHKLGIEDNNGQFKLVDPRAISETLEYELLRRQLSNNAIDTIALDENGRFRIPFEASPMYTQIKNILYSMINKSLISLKTSGGPKVQVPVTLWESGKEGRGMVYKTEKGWEKISIAEYDKLSTDEQQKVRLTSDTLKFYVDEDGQRHCQVTLPHWFKNTFDRKKFPTDKSILDYINRTDPSILMGVAFRIPTQAMSSVEIIKVKGFLPQSMGDTVVVPSEITAKTNSDFDIDKLNTYLKSVYKDEKGDVKLIVYKGSEEATKSFYEDVFNKTIVNDITKIENYEEFRKRLVSIFLQFESISEETPGDFRDILSEEDRIFVDTHESLLNTILDQAEDKEINTSDYILKDIERLGETKVNLLGKLLNSKIKEDYLNMMYKKALENEYYDSLEKMLSIPENFKRLTSPVDDAGLAKIADQLNKLRGENENSIKNRILDRNYMTSLRHDFSTAKRWVGIAAVNIVGHSIAQKIQLHIDPERVTRLNVSDKKILNDCVIVLPHNTTVVNDKTYTSMSGVMTADGSDYISNRLSGYATSFVDVAKDPYIMKIISSELLIGSFMFLERIGVGKTTAMFLNQPIIQEYVKYLDSMNYKYLYKKANLEYITDRFPATKQDIRAATIDIHQFSNNITKYSDKSKEQDSQDNAIQQLILKEFLKYAKMAEFSFKLSQAYNYDTTKFRNSEAVSRKKTKTEIARVSNIFSSVDTLMNATFLKDQKNFIDKAVSSMGAVMKLEEDRFRVITGEVMKVYEEKEFISQDDFDIIASKVKASFLDYVVQIKTKLNDQIAELTTGESSVANQLRKAIEDHPELKLLRDFTFAGSDRENSAETIKLRVNIKEAYDENLHVEMMYELKEIEPILYDNIVKLAILQGTYQTAVSIKNIIPLEDYAAKIKPVIDSLNDSFDVKAFTNGMFQKNNFNNEAIVPIFSPKFFPNVPKIPGVPFNPEEHFPVIDHLGREVYQYVSPLFPNIEQFGRAKDRKILLIDPVYSPLDVKNDFIKIRRSLTLKDGRTIDISTGLSIPSSEYKRRKDMGDQSLKDVYGYQKVKHMNGMPLVTFKGEHVYKLINLLGDGQFVSEYYTDNRKSVLNNGTVKIDNEIPNDDLIAYFTPKGSIKIIEDVDAEVIEDSDELDPELTTRNNLDTLIKEFGEANFNNTIDKFQPNSIYMSSIDIDGNVIEDIGIENYQDIQNLKNKFFNSSDDKFKDHDHFDYNIYDENLDPTSPDLNEEELITYLTPIMTEIRPTLFDKTQLEIPYENIVPLQSQDDNWKEEDNNCPIPF